MAKRSQYLLLLALQCILWTASGHVQAGFVKMESQRCTGTYKWLSEGSRTSCTQSCSGDSSCAGFFMNADQIGCSLFKQGATCFASKGFEAFHKDSRCSEASMGEQAVLRCPIGMKIGSIDFASFGDPTGSCHSYNLSSCDVATAKAALEDLCFGETVCKIAAHPSVLGTGSCLKSSSVLKAEVDCKASDAFHEDHLFNEWSRAYWQAARQDLVHKKAEITQMLANIPEYQNRHGGRGLIIVAGGKYLREAMVSIKLLRSYGFNYRIQIWHLGAEEMSAEHVALMAPYGVETRDFTSYEPLERLKPIAANVGLRRFQLKPLALMHTDLDEVLLLDSDNTPMRNPSYLFDAERYTSTGSLFWPDYWKTSIRNPIWTLLGLNPDLTWEQESGQLVIARERAWRAINLAVYLNSEYFMQLLNGDKDTFRFAWLATGTPFSMVRHQPLPVGSLKPTGAFCAHTMVQHDPAGQPLFVHHNQLKGHHLPIGENFKYAKRAQSDVENVRIVPVAGLEVDDGQISCNDLQGEDASPFGHADDIPLTALDFGQFEVEYLQTYNSLSGTQFASRGAQPQVMRRRRDLNLTANCELNEFELESNSCEKVAVCGNGETETAAPTATSDRLCSSQRDTYTQVINVATATGAFSVQTSGSNAVPEGALVLKRGAQYRFNLDPAVQSDFLLQTTDGTVYNNGVTNNFAVGGESLAFATDGVVDDGINALNYAHGGGPTSSSPALRGGRITFEDPEFNKDVVGARVFDNGLPEERFTTAYNPNVRVFTESNSQTGAPAFRNLRVTCFATCEANAACAGIHIFQTSSGTFCYGLNDLGSATLSIVDSQGWSKQTAARILDPTQ